MTKYTRIVIVSLFLVSGYAGSAETTVSENVKETAAAGKREAKAVGAAVRDAAHKVGVESKQVAHAVADSAREVAHKATTVSRDVAARAKAAVKGDPADQSEKTPTPRQAVK